MPSTRKQKTREKCSIHSEVMFELEDMDVVLGKHSRNEFKNHQNVRAIEVYLESNELQQIGNPMEDFLC